MRRLAWLAPGLAAVVVVLLATARPAAAQLILEDPGDEVVPGGHYHSPQHFAFQLTFGPYRPNVDSEFSSGRHPYPSYFGSGRHLLSQMEFDYQIYHGIGSAGIGLGVGLFQVSGPSPNDDRSGTLSGDRSTLTVVPISLSAIYRFDYYLVERNFPLVPYGKVGLDYAYWQITDGNGEIATDGMGGRGRGGTSGWHAAIGLALVLDMFDPEAARSFDNDLGVNHTAIAFEYGHYDISGITSSNQLHVGDDTWTLGLLFEF